MLHCNPKKVHPASRKLDYVPQWTFVLGSINQGTDYIATIFRAPVRLLGPLSLNCGFNFGTIYSPSYKISQICKWQDSEEDIRHHNIPNWAILYHERKGLSQLKMASGFLPSIKELMACIMFCSLCEIETILLQQTWDLKRFYTVFLKTIQVIVLLYWIP